MGDKFWKFVFFVSLQQNFSKTRANLKILLSVFNSAQLNVKTLNEMNKNPLLTSVLFR